MKVYILFRDVHHDFIDIVSIHATVEGAKKELRRLVEDDYKLEISYLRKNYILSSTGLGAGSRTESLVIEEHEVLE